MMLIILSVTVCYVHRHVDGRDAAGTDKEKIAEWLADYGEDSDFFKVRVRGVSSRRSVPECGNPVF